jgi:1-acyl-sn-glycerol-3-phosphate acyltransferase
MESVSELQVVARQSELSEELSQVEIRQLKSQRLMGWLFVFPLGFLIIFLMRFTYRLKINNHRALRQKFRELSKSNRPMIICPNHLTMVDSVIILWAMASIPRYFLNYRLFAWNIPAIENFKSRLSWRIITYLSKCIAIDRSGDSEHIDEVLEKLRYLLRKGDLCMVFPEGTRSRTGQIDVENASYGIGRIIREIPNCDVLCVYLRGRKQENYSNFPAKGDTIDIEMELITPTTQSKGLRAVKDYSVQIISKLKQMEERHFALRAEAQD